MAAAKEPKYIAYMCELCKVACSSAFQLCEHVMGHKHRTNVSRVSPVKHTEPNNLQYFLDTYIPLEPLVGLERVEEVQMQRGNRYDCVLCGFDGERRPFFSHISGSDHIANYLETHAPELSVRRAMSTQKYGKALQQAAAKYCEIYGRKKMKEVKGNDFTDRDLVLPKTVSDHKTVTGANQSGDFCPKLLRLLDGRADKCRGQPSEFKDNGEFLDYLEKFEIRNDEDAGVLKRILQNCTQALEGFWEEQAPQNQPWEELPGNPQGLANEADKDSAAVNFASSVGPVAPAPQPQTDAMQLFFSSIKNMEESEVVGILHNIAATNPAFRGINVPNTIRYLQATGRLKTS